MSDLAREQGVLRSGCGFPALLPEGLERDVPVQFRSRAPTTESVHEPSSQAQGQRRQRQAVDFSRPDIAFVGRVSGGERS